MYRYFKLGLKKTKHFYVNHTNCIWILWVITWTRCCIAGAVRNSESLHGLHRRGILVGSYGFVVPDSSAGVSFTVAMALSCQIAVRAYHWRELWLCLAKAVRTSRGGRYGCFAPKLCGRIEAVAKAVSQQSCADVSRR